MRCGYSDDLDQRELAMYRGRVASAMRGKRGQRLLRTLLSALNEMPDKRLIANDLVRDGDVCLLGAGGQKLALPDLDSVDPEDHDVLAGMFDVSSCLIQEIEYTNDEAGPWGVKESPEARYARVRKWVESNIRPAAIVAG